MKLGWPKNIYIHVFKNIYLYIAMYIFRCQLLWSMN